MDSREGHSSNEHTKTQVDAADDENDAQDQPMLGNIVNHERQISTSSSSSSDTSSEQDFIQLDARELYKPSKARNEAEHLAPEANVYNDKATGVMQLNLIDDHSTSSEYQQCDQALIRRPFSPRDSDTARLFSPDIPVSHLSSDNFGTTGVMQSPLNQTMVRNDVPDPYRIPASIFTTKSTTPMEWSVASNESLFSIHMSTSSFSRDNAFLLGRSGELNNFCGSTLESYTPPISPTTSDPINVGAGHGLAQPGMAEAANAEAMKEVLRAAAEVHADNKKPQLEEGVAHSTSISRHSDSSVTSFRSFAFPILTGDRCASLKVEPEHHSPKPEQPQQPATPVKTLEAPPEATPGKNRWFPCFSCSFSCC